MKNKLFIALLAVFAFIQVNAQSSATTDEGPHTVILPTQIPSLSEQNIDTEEETEPVIEIETEETKPQENCKMNERTMETDCKQTITIRTENSNGMQTCKNCVH